jgi:polysaccharide pyruvyl transferase WcaK-like protein
MANQTTKRPVIYLIGTSGHPNYGDELITAAWLRHYARTWPDAEVWLDSPRPGQSAVLMDGLHRGLRCVDTLYHACWNSPTSSAAETIDFGARVIGEPGLIAREATGVENLSQVDLVHILGGGYINKFWPQNLALIGAARGMRQRHGTRAALTGAGLTPFVPGSEAPMVAALDEFDLVDVRDVPTHSNLTYDAPRTMMSGDDALLAFDSPPGARPIYGTTGAAPTMLCLQSDMLERPLEEIADYVVRTVKEWGVDQDPITLVECNPPADVAVAALLRPHLPQLEVLPFSFLWRGGLPAQPGQRWISTRLHCHIVAAAAGAWGVAISLSRDYYRTKHQMLLQKGSGWALASDLDQPVPAGSAPAEPFGGALPGMVAAKRDVADRASALVRKNA